MKYNVLVIDPPWRYKKPETGGSLKSGASQIYDVMSLEDIKNLNIYFNRVIEKDCALFLWITNPMIQEGLDLIRHWGFTYKTMVTWIKTNCLGLGYYFRGNTEHILVATKGNVKAFRCQKVNYIQSKLLEHSEKPKEFNELIELATKNMNPKYLELFARRQYKSWTCLGFDLTGKDIKEDLQQIVIEDIRI